MELSRGDALAALGAAGVVSMAGHSPLVTDGSGGTTVPDPGAPREAVPDVATADTVPVETAAALADVLYPSDVTGVETFVGTYLRGRAGADQAYHAALRDGAETLDEWARAAFDAPFAALDAEQRERLLADMGVRVVDSVPDGSEIARLNYHLVDELLFALYASPGGKALVGVGESGSVESETPGSVSR